MKYFSWLSYEHLTKEEEKEQEKEHRVDLAIMLGVISLFSIVICILILLSFSKASLKERQKLGEEGYQLYLSEYQTLDQDVREIENGWDPS